MVKHPNTNKCKKLTNMNNFLDLVNKRINEVSEKVSYYKNNGNTKEMFFMIPEVFGIIIVIIMFGILTVPLLLIQQIINAITWFCLKNSLHVFMIIMLGILFWIFEIYSKLIGIF